MDNFKKKKYIASIMIVLLFLGIIGLINIGRIDKYEGLVKVKNATSDASILSANINQISSDSETTAKGYDEVDYTIKYSLDEYADVSNRDVIIKGTLTSQENKYAKFKKITGDNITTTLSENKDEIQVRVNNVELGVENSLTLKITIENAPNNFTINPNITIKEATEENENIITTQVVTVQTKSFIGKVLNENDSVVSNIELSLNQNDTEIKRTYSDSDGNFVFSDLEDGNYQIKVEEDKYILTSDANISIPVTSNYDIKIKEIEPYTIKTNKYITNATLVINGKTNTYTYGQLEKVQQAVKNAKTLQGEIKYKIVVKNTGTKEGLITAVIDEVQDGLKFDASNNSGWEEENGKLYYRPIEGVTLNKDEERSIPLTLTIVETNAAKTYLNKMTAKGEIYEKVVYLLDGKKYKELNVLEGEKIDEPTITLDDFSGWYTDSNYTNKYNFNLEVKKDLILYGKTKEVATYKVTFIDQGNIWGEQQIKEGDKATKPEDPTKEGHTFKCWQDENENVWDFNNPIEKNTTLTSCYDKNSYTVEFYDKASKNGAQYELVKTIHKLYEELIENSDVPTLEEWEGHTFVKWTTDERGNEDFDFTSPIKKNIKLYSQYTKQDRIVIFNDENRITEKTVEYDSVVEEIESQGKTGYNFMYWSLVYDGEDAFDFNTKITQPTTLYAVYKIKSYNVTFIDQENVWDEQTINHGSPAQEPEDPTKEGSTFKGWYNGDDKWDFDTPVTEEITLTSKYDINKIKVDFVDGEDLFESKKINYGTSVTPPQDNPSKEHYIFKGWKLNASDENTFAFSTILKEDTILYSSYEFVEKPDISHTPTTWTNDKVTVTISSSHTDYSYMYRIDNGDYREYTEPFIVDRNCRIYAYSKKESAISEENYHDITNIDKINPSIKSLSATDVSQNYITISAIAKDDESGLGTITIYKDDELVTTISYDTDVNEEKNASYTLDGLEASTSYRIKVIATDIAGNVSDAFERDFETSGIDPVCQIIGRGGSLYNDDSQNEQFSTLSSAITSCGNNQCTIQMLKSVNESNNINSGQTITLDLNSYTITGVRDTTFNNSGNFTIIDNAEEAGSILNNASTAITTTGTLTIGVNESDTNPEVSDTKPYIQGKTTGIAKTSGILNFYDGKIVGKVAIDGVVDATPYLYNADVKSQTNEDEETVQVAALQILSDAEARIGNKYYTKVHQAVEESRIGEYVDILHDTTFQEGMTTTGEFGFEYDDELDAIVSNNNIESSIATSTYTLDLRNYTTDQELDIEAYIISNNLYSDNVSTQESGRITITNYDSGSTISPLSSNNNFSYLNSLSRKTNKYLLPAGSRYNITLSFTAAYESDAGNDTDGKMVISNMTLEDYILPGETEIEQSELVNSYTSYGFIYDAETDTFVSNNQYKHGSYAFSYIEIDLTDEEEDKILSVNATLDTYGYSNFGDIAIKETNEIQYSYNYNDFAYIYASSSGKNYIGPINFKQQLTKGKKYYLQFYYFKNGTDYINNKSYPTKEDYESVGVKDQFIINSIDLISTVDPASNSDKIQKYDLSTDLKNEVGSFSKVSNEYYQPVYDSSNELTDSYVELDFTDSKTNQIVNINATLNQGNLKYFYVSDSKDAISYENLKNDKNLLLSYSNGYFENNSRYIYSDKNDYKYILEKGKKYYLHFAQISTNSSSYYGMKLYSVVSYPTNLSPESIPVQDYVIENNEFRYIGKNPNNYVSFNNELWRIVGIFDTEGEDGTTSPRIKLVRNASIGSYSWDTSVKNNNDGTENGSSNNGYGINEWSQADLMKLLNPGYDDNEEETFVGIQGSTDVASDGVKKVNNSLYWNRESGNCFSNFNNIASTCDFTSSGLDATSKTFIDTVVWNTGASVTSISSLTAYQLHDEERGDKTGKEGYSKSSFPPGDDMERTTTWTGKVGLLYPSDIALAADKYLPESNGSPTRSGCLTSPTGSMLGACMTTNDWLYDNSNTYWTITPSNGWGAGQPYFGINYNNYSYAYYPVAYPFTIKPVVYLSTKTQINGGTGTSDDPYTLILGTSNNTLENYGLTPAEEDEDDSSYVDPVIGNSKYSNSARNQEILGFNYDEETNTYTTTLNSKEIASSYFEIDNTTGETQDLYLYSTSDSNISGYAYISDKTLDLNYYNTSYNYNVLKINPIVSGNATGIYTIESGKKYYVYLGAINTSNYSDKHFSVRLEYRKITEQTSNITTYEDTIGVLNEEADTVQILKNISLTNSIEIDSLRNMELDLNGYNLTTTQEDYVIKNYGSLKIFDSKYNAAKEESSSNSSDSSEEESDIDTTKYIEDQIVFNYSALDHGEDDTVWKDLSGNGNDGTISGATWQDGGLYFGRNGYVSIGQFSDETFTIEVTSKINYPYTGNYTLASNYNSGGYSLKYNYYSGSTKLISSQYGFTNMTNIITQGELYTTTLTYDGTTFKLYQNGNLIDSRSGSNYTPQAEGTNLMLGKESSGTDYFRGTIYSARYYSKALSEREVLNNYVYDSINYMDGNYVDENKEIFLSSINNQYNSDIWNDISSNNNNATINGATWNESERALVFDGIDDYLSIENVSFKKQTYEIVFKVKEIKNQTLFSLNDSQDFYVGIDDKNMLYTSYTVNGREYKDTYQMISLDTLYTLSIEYYNSNLYVYLNGDLLLNYKNLSVGNIDNETINIIIGSSKNYDNFYSGNVYSFRVYSSALSAKKILDHYNLDKNYYNGFSNSKSQETNDYELPTSGISSSTYSVIYNEENANLELEGINISSSKLGDYYYIENLTEDYNTTIANKGNLSLTGNTKISPSARCIGITNFNTGDIESTESNIYLLSNSIGIYNVSTREDGISNMKFIGEDYSNNRYARGVINKSSNDLIFSNITYNVETNSENYPFVFNYNINYGKIKVYNSNLKGYIFNGYKLELYNSVINGKVTIKYSDSTESIIKNSIISGSSSKYESSAETTIDNVTVYDNVAITAHGTIDNLYMYDQTSLNGYGTISNLYMYDKSTFVNKGNTEASNVSVRSISNTPITNNSVMLLKNSTLVSNTNTINNTKTLTLDNVNISSNSSAIINTDTLKINNSDISANDIAISNSGTLTLLPLMNENDMTSYLSDSELPSNYNVDEKISVIKSNDSIGVSNTGIFNFYSGKIVGTLDNSITGTINEIPNEYDTFVTKNEANEEVILSKIDNTSEEKAVAAIGETKYASIQDAVAHVPDDNTETEIKILRDIYTALDINIPNTKNVKINYDNHYIKAFTPDTFINNKGTLSLFDDTETITKDNVIYSNKYFDNEGNIEFSNLLTTMSLGSTFMDNKGTFVLNSGIINNKGKFANNDGTIIMNDGIINSDMNLTKYNQNKVYSIDDEFIINNQTGIIEINNITVDYQSSKNFITNYNELTINDGTFAFQGKSTNNFIDNYKNVDIKGGKYDVSGNTYTGTGSHQYTAYRAIPFINNNENANADITGAQLAGEAETGTTAGLYRPLNRSKIIVNNGTATIKNITSYFTGGIENNNALEIDSSTLRDIGYLYDDYSTDYTCKRTTTTCLTTYDGSIINNNDLTITDSTIQGNGGLLLNIDATLNISGSTLQITKVPYNNKNSNKSQNVILLTGASEANITESTITNSNLSAATDMNSLGSVLHMKDSSTATLDNVTMYNIKNIAIDDSVDKPYAIYDNSTGKLIIKGSDTEIGSKHSALYITSSGDVDIISGKIYTESNKKSVNANDTTCNSTAKSAIENNGTGTISFGVKSDGVVSKTLPHIDGSVCNSIGLNTTNSESTVNIYDGLFDGTTAIYGSINEVEDGYEIITDSAPKNVGGQYYPNESKYLDKSFLIVNDTTNQKYYDIQTAVNEAGLGDTLSLLRSYTTLDSLTTIVVPNTKRLTINLAGFNIYANNATFIDNKGILTIEDTGTLAYNTITGAKDYSTTDYAIIDSSTGTLFTNSGVLNLNGGIYSASNSIVINTGELNVSSKAIILNEITNNNDMNISGGVFDVDSKLTNTGTLDITDGNIFNEITNTGTLNITGGYFEGKGKSSSTDYEYFSLENTGEANIENITTGGTFNNKGTGTLNLKDVNLIRSAKSVSYSPISASETSYTEIDNVTYENTYTTTANTTLYYSSYAIKQNSSNVITATGSANIYIKSIDIDTTGYGINASSSDSSVTLTIDDADITTKYGYAISVNGNLVIHDGNYIREDDNNYPSSKLNSTYKYGNTISYTSSDENKKLTLEKGIIRNTNGNAINSSGTATIGKKDSNIDNENLIIEGSEYGLFATNVNYYDGKIIGKTAINGMISEIENNSAIHMSINDDVETKYLSSNKVFKNTRTNSEYLNLNDAISESQNGDTIQLIDSYTPLSTDAVINNKSIILDLNGYRLDSNVNSYITNNSTLEIIDNKSNSTVSGYVDDNIELSLSDVTNLSTSTGRVTVQDLSGNERNIDISNTGSGQISDLDYENITYETTFEIYQNKTQNIISNKSKGCTIYIDNNSNIVGSCYIDGAYQNILYPSVKINKKYHVALTYDGSNLKMYVNSTLVDTYVSSNNSSVDYNAGNITYIGEKNSSNYMVGKIYSIRIYSDALTSDEVKQNYNLDNNNYFIDHKSGIKAKNTFIKNNNVLNINKTKFNSDDLLIENASGATSTINLSSIYSLSKSIDNFGTININKTSIIDFDNINENRKIVNNENATLKIDNRDRMIIAKYMILNHGTLNIESGYFIDNKNLKIISIASDSSNSSIYNDNIMSIKDSNVNGIVFIDTSNISTIENSYICFLYDSNGSLDIDSTNIDTMSVGHDYYNGIHYLKAADYDLISMNDVTIKSSLTLRSSEEAGTFIFDGGKVHGALLHGGQLKTIKNITFGDKIELYGNSIVDNITSTNGYIINYGDTEIKNSNITSDRNTLTSSNGTITLENNNFTSEYNNYSYAGHAINISSGNLNIISGNYISNKATGLNVTSSTVTVTIGENSNGVSITNPKIEGVTYGVNNSIGANISFYDGVLIGAQNQAFIGAIQTIENGYNINLIDDSNDKQNAYLVAISEEERVAVLNNINYKTLQDAINACGTSSACNITIYTNITLNENLVVSEGKVVNVYKNSYTITPDEYITNHDGTGTINIMDGTPSGLASVVDAVKDALNIDTITKNIIIYEMEDGSSLSSEVTYKLYEDDKLLKMSKTDEIGIYTKGNSIEELKTVRGRLYINDLGSGSYKLVGSDNKEISFTITDDYKIVGNVREYTADLDNAKVSSSSQAEYIIMMQTGVVRGNYLVLIALISAIISLIYLVRKKSFN